MIRDFSDLVILGLQMGSKLVINMNKHMQIYCKHMSADLSGLAELRRGQGLLYNLKNYEVAVYFLC
jgi:hypothetical protein